MNPYQASDREALPGVILDQPIDYDLSESQRAALTPEAQIGLVVVSEVMQRSFESTADITKVLAEETGLEEEVLTKARHVLTGSRGSERMRLDMTNGFRLLLTAHGLDFLNKQVAHVKKGSPDTNGSIESLD